jgi:hypothetical protein
VHLIAVLVNACDIRDIGRCRHILDNRVKELLNTFIFVSRTTAYRDN